MIKIHIPFKGQGAGDMIHWVVEQGLIFRSEWWWDSKNGDYVFSFAEEHEKTAAMFALRWS